MTSWAYEHLIVEVAFRDHRLWEELGAKCDTSSLEAADDFFALSSQDRMKRFKRSVY